MFRIDRRSFIKSAGVTLVSAMAGIKLGFVSRPALAGGPANSVLINVFLRGGIDGLNLVVPISGNDRNHYESYRSSLRISVAQALSLGAGQAFGLHPACAGVTGNSATPPRGLDRLWQDGKLAIVHATGMTPQTVHSRSHFDAQEQLELGTPGQQSSSDGWLTRHLLSSPVLNPEAILPALAAGSSAPHSLRGTFDVMALDTPSSFHPNADFRYADSHLLTLGEMYDGNSPFDQSVQGALDSVVLLNNIDLSNYTPAGGALYPISGPGTTLGSQAQMVAQLIKLELGLSTVTLDYGGWDTHNGQGGATGSYADRLQGLSQALHALYTDLAASGFGERVIIVVQSEFGRRVRENGNSGTDHGTGNPMLVIGGRVRGGQFYGNFPGIANAQLFQGADMAITTDFRSVYGEILESQLGNPNIDFVFPNFNGYQPLGLLPSERIFSSGFEAAG